MFLIIILATLSSAFVLLKFLIKPPQKSLKGRHVLITGGSSGIGKAVAILAAKKGAHVTLIARNLDKLSQAQKEVELEVEKDTQKVTIISGDVSDRAAVETNIAQLEEKVGPIYMLINCAGLSICGRLEDMADKDIQHLINVNLLGTIYPIKALIPKFKQRKEGVIVLTASAVALTGMYGMSIYSACKFALRGLAESIHMELKPYNVSVTLALPPDTDTPGFEAENKSKPKVTKLLCETAGLHAPEAVAKQLLDDALSGQFFSYVGFEGFILATLCVGMSPFKSVFDLLAQFVTLGPLRIISAFYIKHFDGVINKCLSESEVHTKPE